MPIIDRFESDFAVLDDNGKMLTVPRDRLPAGAREGDAVRLSPDGCYLTDTEQSEKRRRDLAAFFRRLKK